MGMRRQWVMKAYYQCFLGVGVMAVGVRLGIHRQQWLVSYGRLLDSGVVGRPCTI